VVDPHRSTAATVVIARQIAATTRPTRRTLRPEGFGAAVSAGRLSGAPGGVAGVGSTTRMRLRQLGQRTTRPAYLPGSRGVMRRVQVGQVMVRDTGGLHSEGGSDEPS
jgi:hypothetical protein